MPKDSWHSVSVMLKYLVVKRKESDFGKVSTFNYKITALVWSGTAVGRLLVKTLNNVQGSRLSLIHI